MAFDLRLDTIAKKLPTYSSTPAPTAPIGPQPFIGPVQTQTATKPPPTTTVKPAAPAATTPNIPATPAATSFINQQVSSVAQPTPLYDPVTGTLTAAGRAKGLGDVNAPKVSSAPQSAYLDFLRKQFNPDALTTASKNIDELNKRTSEELLRARTAEDTIRKNEKGQLESGQTFELNENARLSNRSLADLAIAKGYATDIYQKMLDAGATVQQADDAAQKAATEAAKPIEVGGVLYKPQTDGTYRPVTPGAGPTLKTSVVDVNGHKVLIDEATGATIKDLGVSDINAAPPGQPTQYQVDTNQRIVDAVDALLPQVSNSTTGLGGSIANLVPGTAAANFSAQLDTLKANISFGALAQMREASKTGGALGQISDREEALLAATLGALSLRQSPEALKAQLEKIKDSITRWNQAVQQYGGGGGGSGGYQVQGLNVIGPDGTTYQFDSQQQLDAWKSASGFNSVGKTSASTTMRTDRNNNPTAFTTDIARIAGLKEGVDYVVGDPFNNGKYHTARLLGDPIATTIKAIDKIGFYTQSGQPRWTYINQIPQAQNWSRLSYDQKKAVVAQMYKHEGGSQLAGLFTNTYA